MRELKLSFDAVVRENLPWLYAYIRSKVRNPDIAEDLLQEVWLKAYRAYDNYCENGHLKSWLMRIAQNHLRNYYAQSSSNRLISLDAAFDDEDSLYAYLSEGRTVEEDYLLREQVDAVLSAIARLPARQKQVITYRFLYDMKLSETADILRIPEGTVKSTTHLAIQKIRADFEPSKTRQNRGKRPAAQTKGAHIMECREIYKYLFIYANKTITPEDKAKVEAHLAECKACADIVTALEKLIPTLVFAKEDELSHFLIDFPHLGLQFCGMRHELENFEQLNRRLTSWGGKIPEHENWMVSGYGKAVTMLGTFDNEGNEMEFITYERDEFHMEKRAVYIKKVFRYMWEYETYISKEHPYSIRKAKEAPNLYYGSMQNHFGTPVKSALYQAIPGTAENIRIKRGNGVIDGGTYKFPYVDRYIAGDESIALEYSFNLNQ